MGLCSTADAALNTICGLVSEGEGHLRRILCVCVCVSVLCCVQLAFSLEVSLGFSLGLILEYIRPRLRIQLSR